MTAKRKNRTQHAQLKQSQTKTEEEVRRRKLKLIQKKNLRKPSMAQRMTLQAIDIVIFQIRQFATACSQHAIWLRNRVLWAHAKGKERIRRTFATMSAISITALIGKVYNKVRSLCGDNCQEMSITSKDVQIVVDVGDEFPRDVEEVSEITRDRNGVLPATTKTTKKPETRFNLSCFTGMGKDLLCVVPGPQDGELNGGHSSQRTKSVLSESSTASTQSSQRSESVFSELSSAATPITPSTDGDNTPKLQAFDAFNFTSIASETTKSFLSFQLAGCEGSGATRSGENPQTDTQAGPELENISSEESSAVEPFPPYEEIERIHADLKKLEARETKHITETRSFLATSNESLTEDGPADNGGVKWLRPVKRMVRSARRLKATEITDAEPYPVAPNRSTDKPSPEEIHEVQELPPAKRAKRSRKRVKRYTHGKVSPDKPKNGVIATGTDEDSTPGKGPDGEEKKNNDYCGACADHGELLWCNGCPNAFHGTCLEPPMATNKPPLAQWYCPQCVKCQTQPATSESQTDDTPPTDLAANDDDDLTYNSHDVPTRRPSGTVAERPGHLGKTQCLKQLPLKRRTMSNDQYERFIWAHNDPMRSRYTDGERTSGCWEFEVSCWWD